MNKGKTKRGPAKHRNIRYTKTNKTRTTQTKLFFAILRGFLAGIGSASLMLCMLALVFANTGLPLNWAGPAACGAAAVGTFVSGLVLSRSVPRYRLLAGSACGVFYCLCAVGAGLLSSQIPSVNEANLSLLAVLMLGAVAGSAAGALHRDGSSFAGVH